jgi:hypothetical protein
MAFNVNSERGCYDPGGNIRFVNVNTNELNTFSSSMFRYPSAFSGDNWYLYGYTPEQLKTFFEPTNLDLCVSSGQEYFFHIIDTTSPQVQSTLSLLGGFLTGGFMTGGVLTRVPVPTCGVPQNIPPSFLNRLNTTPTAAPISQLGTTSGGGGATGLYGNTQFGAYVRETVVSCSTAQIDSTGRVGGFEEFFVTDTNSNYITIRYNSNSRKLQPGETITFTVNEVVNVSTSGTYVDYRWSPTFNRSYANRTYNVTVGRIVHMDDINMHHVEVGPTAARFQSDMTITGPNGLSFVVKSGRNIQTRCAIYGRWEFDQKKVYWLKQFTKPISSKEDVFIGSIPTEIISSTNISESDRKYINNSTKSKNVTASGSVESSISRRTISNLYDDNSRLNDDTKNTIRDAVKGSPLTTSTSNSFDIDMNKNVNDAISSTLNVKTSYNQVDHFVKSVELSENKSFIHTNPANQESVDALNQAGITNVDVNKTVLSIPTLPNYGSTSKLNRNDLSAIASSKSKGAKEISDACLLSFDSASQSYQGTNETNNQNPYNNNAGPSNNNVKEYGPVNSFDKLPRSTLTEKIQPYRYEADERMDKLFSFRITTNLLATQCGPCYTLTSGIGTTSTSSTCSSAFATKSSISVPFEKVFINNLTPEAQRWTRIVKNYQDNFEL